MKLGGFSKILESMFTDKMSIRRYQDVTNDDKTTDIILPDTPLYEGVPCRLSFVSGENPEEKEIDDVPVSNVMKIFCGECVNIRAGDFIKVERFNDDGVVIATYAGKVGLPSKYITHQEVLFFIQESA